MNEITYKKIEGTTHIYTLEIEDYKDWNGERNRFVLEVSPKSVTDQDRYNLTLILISKKEVPNQIKKEVDESSFGCKSYIINETDDLDDFIDTEILFKDITSKCLLNTNSTHIVTVEKKNQLHWFVADSWSTHHDIAYNIFTKLTRLSPEDTNYSKLVISFCRNLAEYVMTEKETFTIYVPEISEILLVKSINLIREMCLVKKITTHIICANDNIFHLIDKKMKVTKV